METQESYTSADARKICTLLYGKTIYPSTWASWREEVHIESNRRKLTEYEYLLLCSVAHVRSVYPKKHLTWELVEPVMLEIRGIVAAAFKKHSVTYRIASKTIKSAPPEVKTVQGKDIKLYLRNKGINPPSFSTFKRKIAGFSMLCSYPERMILAITKECSRSKKRQK